MHERLERLEGEVFHLGEAVAHLKQVRGCEDYVALLEDKLVITTLERGVTHMLCEMQDEREEDELRQEYEVSTL